MRPYDPKALAIIGTVYALRDAVPQNARRKLEQAVFVLKEFALRSAKEVGLNKAIRPAELLISFAESFLSDPNFNFEDNSWRTFLMPELDRFESALAHDIEALYVYVLEKKRGYSVDTLLENIIECLPQDDRNLLPDFAYKNLQEAGVCLLFERFTACGYHLSRAVEDVARRYYEVVTGIEPKQKGLGQVAGELKGLLDKGKNQGLLPLIAPTLEQFCRIYRNPLSHTQEIKMLSESEADVVFGHAISGISTVLEDVRKGGAHFLDGGKIPAFFPGSKP